MPLPGWGIFKNRVMATMVGTAAGMAAADALGAPFRVLAYEVERELTNRVLTPGQLAELAARGFADAGVAVGEAAASGISANRFGALAELATQPPAPGELLELLRRGAIGPDRYARGLRQASVRPEWIGELATLRDRILSPGELAELVARGLAEEAGAQAEASRAGLTAGRFELLQRLAARPPQVGQLLELVNRGDVDEGRARRAIADLGIRGEWADELLELRFQLPPPTDLVRFGVREVFTPAIRERYRLAEDFPDPIVEWGRRIGLSREVLELYWQAHWDLPSAGQGFQMFHRSIIDRPGLRELLRALDVNPYWRDRLIELAYRVPGRIDLRRMYRFGVITQEQLLQGYLRLGYAPADAAFLVKFAIREKAEPERDLTKGEWLRLYSEGAIEREAALAALVGMGYDETEAGQLLLLADAQRARRLRDQVIRVVRGRYIKRAIDADTARQRLTAAGIPQGEQDFNLELWDLEREVEEPEGVRHITEAQMRAAWHRKLVDEDRYRGHLAVLRLPADEAELLVRLYRK